MLDSSSPSPERGRSIARAIGWRSSRGTSVVETPTPTLPLAGGGSAQSCRRTNEADFITMPSQRACAKSVAGVDGALLEPGHEPALALFGAAVGERVGHHAPSGLPLQGIVADRSRGLQRSVDVALLEEVRTLLLFAIGPHAGETIGLQLDLDLQGVGFGLTRGLLLHRVHFRDDAEQVLHVMAGLVRDDVGLRELAGLALAAAEPGLDLAEEAGVEKNLLLRWAVERAHRRLG